MREALGVLRPEHSRHPVPVVDASRPKALNLMGLFAHHPALTQAYNTFNSHLLFNTTLTPRQRELVVLRVGVVRGAEYEWRQHVIMGLEAGLSEEEIDRVTVGPAADGWSPLDRAMLAAADELLADATVSDATYAALAAELDTQQLMDLVFTVGAYETVAMFMRTFQLEIDDDLRAWQPPSRT